MKNFSWKESKVTHMHIELSNFCNAACPFCPRYVDSTARVRPELQLNSITLEQFKKWFPLNFMKSVERILFCGTHGDPLMAKDVIEIIDYIQTSSPKCTIQMNTNGGMRSPEFFRALGKKLVEHGTNHRVVFSIDGLKDTNHLYRRNVKWEKLIENAIAFNSTGARGLWEYLIFEHNEHQLEEAKQLSEELGFYDIKFKKALGFDPNKSGQLKARGVYDKNGDLEYIISPPSDQSMINSSCVPNSVDKNVKTSKDITYLKDFKPGVNPIVESKVANFDEAKIPHWNTYIKQFENSAINCKSCVKSKSSEIYVSCDGIVFPCCFIGTRVDSAIDLYEDTQLRHHIKQFGKDKFDLKKTSIKKIIKRGYLDSVYTDSWDKESYTNGKLSYCAMTCGNNSEIDRIYDRDD